MTKKKTLKKYAFLVDDDEVYLYNSLGNSENNKKNILVAVCGDTIVTWKLIDSEILKDLQETHEVTLIPKGFSFPVAKPQEYFYGSYPWKGYNKDKRKLTNSFYLENEQGELVEFQYPKN